MKLQKGAAMIEYVIVATVISAAIFTPVNDQFLPDKNGENVAMRLIVALKDNQAKYQYFTTATIAPW